MEKKDWGQKSCEKIIFAEEDSLVVATNLDLVMQFWLPTKGQLILNVLLAYLIQLITTTNFTKHENQCHQFKV
jgi:hypothetical protein